MSTRQWPRPASTRLTATVIGREALGDKSATFGDQLVRMPIVLSVSRALDSQPFSDLSRNSHGTTKVHCGQGHRSVNTCTQVVPTDAECDGMVFTWPSDGCWRFLAAVSSIRCDQEIVIHRIISARIIPPPFPTIFGRHCCHGYCGIGPDVGHASLWQFDRDLLPTACSLRFPPFLTGSAEHMTDAARYNGHIGDKSRRELFVVQKPKTEIDRKSCTRAVAAAASALSHYRRGLVVAQRGRKPRPIMPR